MEVRQNKQRLFYFALRDSFFVVLRTYQIQDNSKEWNYLP